MNPDARMFFGRTPPPDVKRNSENKYCPRCLKTTIQNITPNGFECQRCAKMKAMKFEDKLNFVFRNIIDEDSVVLKFIPMIW